MSSIEPKTIAIDFDGTLVFHEFPKIGAEIPLARMVLQRLAKAGHRLILWTCRSGHDLLAAVNFVELDMGIDLYCFNSNGIDDAYSGCPKIFADLYIDDASLGTPLSNWHGDVSPIRQLGCRGADP